MWLGVAVLVAVVLARMASRGEQASEMASLTRDVRRADSAATASAAPPQVTARGVGEPTER